MHELPDQFFDAAGAPMSAAEFRKAYPQRMRVRVTEVPVRLLIMTEFVGINHTQSGTPKIYETSVYYAGVAGPKFVSSRWSGGLKRARAVHASTAAAAWLGLGVWWWLRARSAS